MQVFRTTLPVRPCPELPPIRYQFTINWNSE